MALQAVILDVDGTLVLSNDAHAQAWVDAFGEFSYKVSFEQVRPLIGMGGDHVVTVTFKAIIPPKAKTPEELGYPPGFFERTFGSLRDEPLEREEQGADRRWRVL